ncbi:MAG: alpha/beta hydrolase [Deltaproteobacteria bacterium]|nr:alpha/beta hydrolase [Deltaproteobacteria bacterium]
MAVAGLREKTLTTADGTRLAYQVRGTGPAIVFANGLGGTYTAWRHQYASLGSDYTIVSWDYRGLFGSSRPSDLATLAIDRQVADLRDILDAEGIERAILVGWSMGVQFNFEFHRQYPERVSGIISASGTAGRPFDSILLVPHLQRILPCVLRGARHVAPIFAPIVRVASTWRGLVPVMERLGMVAASLDHAVLEDIAEAFGGLDFEVYVETFRQLGLHDCRESLGDIAVPVLVICGTKDMLTPVSVAEDLAARIPGAELALVEGGTHYVAVEFPEEVNGHIARLVRQVYPGGPSTA